MNIELRVITDGPRAPEFNMAADRYLLDQAQSTGIVFLRLYEWKPPAISLGYMQDSREILLPDRLEQDGIAWVRRPTGGRAVLHWNDLTYCCAFPKSDQMGKSIGESYGLIARCLRRGLAIAGIHAETSDSELDSREVRREIKLPCFLAPNRDEIMVRGKKLIGSAQKRTDGAVLQHGSIPIADSYRKLPFYMNLDEQQQRVHSELLKRKTVCTDEICRGITAHDLGTALVDGFAEILHTSPSRVPWTPNELEAIHRFLAPSGDTL